MLEYARAHPTWSRVVLRLLARPALVGQLGLLVKQDLLRGHAQGRFSAPPDDLTVDMVVGTMSMAIHRFAAGEGDVGLPARATQRLLELLGIPPDAAVELVARAASTPLHPQRPSGEST